LLYNIGGVNSSCIDTEKSEKLPNNYCYFNINTKTFNIKVIYKLLRILFEKSEQHIVYKTIITITGKYGERGYSFTSNDYNNYSLHLTDQYFVSHASLNCTDISQRLRLQGKYNDLELKNGLMKLTLWTTSELQDIIQTFYVKFIEQIEKFIMDCKKWEEIKDLLESIIDKGDFKFRKYMKYIDVSKKRKNLKIIKHFDIKNNGYKLILYDDMNDTEIKEWCKEKNLPNYICINEIKEISVNEFIDKYGDNENKITFIKLKEDVSLNYINKEIDSFNYTNNTNISHIKPSWISDRIKQKKNDIWYEHIRSEWKKYTKNDFEKELKAGLMKDSRRIHLCYDELDNLCLCIIYWGNNMKLPKQTNDYKKIPYIVNDDIVKYSLIKDEYQQKNTQTDTNKDIHNYIEDEKLPNQYYWKTLDGWLYLYDKNKPEIVSLNVVAPFTNILEKNIIETNTLSEQLINNDILLFTQSCCKNTDKKNLRFGIKEIYEIYKNWCNINSKKILKTQKKFKEEFEKLNYKKEKSKGVDLNNNSGKRGYNIMVSL
jgi:hypothetical protein